MNKLEEALQGLTPNEQLFLLEKLAMKIRKANSKKIYADAMKFSYNHPKQKEESNNYR